MIFANSLGFEMRDKQKKGKKGTRQGLTTVATDS